MIRVAIVEDHAMVRQSLARLVRSEDDLEVVAEAGSAEEALPRLLGTEPDVALLDISLPGMDGIGLAARLKRSLPNTRIVFLTMHEDDSTVARAVGVGTDGYIPKSVDANDVVAAIRAVAAGESYVSASLMRRVMDIAGGRAQGPADRLTEREREVLRLLARGERPDEIAGSLHLSVKTVKNHLTSVYAKLGVETAAQAVAEAYRLRIVRLDEQASESVQTA
jgi:DNA-binding NarL/FixJ family response regulator